MMVEWNSYENRPCSLLCTFRISDIINFSVLGVYSCFTANLVSQHVRVYASFTTFNSLRHYHLRKTFTHLYKKLFCLLHFNENNLNNKQSFVTRNVEMFSRLQTMKSLAMQRLVCRC